MHRLNISFYELYVRASVCAYVELTLHHHRFCCMQNFREALSLMLLIHLIRLRTNLNWLDELEICMRIYAYAERKVLIKKNPQRENGPCAHTFNFTRRDFSRIDAAAICFAVGSREESNQEPRPLKSSLVIRYNSLWAKKLLCMGHFFCPMPRLRVLSITMRLPSNKHNNI